MTVSTPRGGGGLVVILEPVSRDVTVTREWHRDKMNG